MVDSQMSSNKSRFGAPRRLISQLIWFLDVAIVSAGANLTLFTAEDPVTLVRAVFTGTYRTGAVPTTAISRGFMGLQITRKGQTALNPAISQGLVDIDELAWPILWARSISAESGVIVADIDVKSMRKMRDGDILSLWTRGNINTDAPTLTGTLRLFFKEA